MNITNIELLVLLEEKGYTISLQHLKTTVMVTFHNEPYESYSPPASYSTDFTGIEIKELAAGDLLRWSGLHIKYALERK